MSFLKEHWPILPVILVVAIIVLVIFKLPYPPRVEQPLQPRDAPPSETRGLENISPSAGGMESQGSQSIVDITFIRPRHREAVPSPVNVEYRVEGRIPQGYHPVLLVRDPLGQYWSWGASPSHRHIGVQIGVVEDSGKDFEIGVLVTKTQIPLNQPRRTLPPGLVFRSIVVTRQR